MTTTPEPRRPYIVIHQESGEIVGRLVSTHARLEALCERWDRTRPGTYIYDDASEAHAYDPKTLGRTAEALRGRIDDLHMKAMR